MIDLASGQLPGDVAAAAREDDVLVSEWSATRLRLVTHLDVSADDCRRAGHVLRRILERAARTPNRAVS
jgi:threonine aldolase